MKSIKLRGIVAAVSGAVMFGAAVPAMADSTDDIINALMAKGVLTEEEGALLMKGRTGEKEAAAKKKESAITASFKDGIVFESGDKQTKFSINGRIQEDYRSFSTQVTDNQADTWDTRRAYLTAKGTFYDTIDFEATYNGAGSSGSDLLYAWLNARYWDEAQFKFGQFKEPMGLEELGSSRFLNFTERSFVSQLAPATSRGGQFHGNYKGLTYALGMFNGVGVNGGQNTNDTSIDNDGKSYTGRVTANIAEFMDKKDTVFHLGASYNDSKENSSTSAITMRSEARGTNILQTNNTTIAGYDIKRNGLEGAVAFGPVKFQSEYMKAKFEPGSGDILVSNVSSATPPVTTLGSSGDKDIKAWYASVNWLITGESYADTYKNGMFGGRIKPKADFNPRAGLKGWGAWDVGVRYSKFDATDFEKKDLADVYNNGGGSTAKQSLENGWFNEADAWTVGLKWMPNPNTRFILDYIDTSMECVSGQVCTEDEEKAMNFRAQFDF